MTTHLQEKSDSFEPDLENNQSLEIAPIQGEAKRVLKYAYNKNKGKMPRRNKSAFILFSIETRAKLKAQFGDNMNSNEMMVKLADLWKNLNEEERARFKNEAENDKIRYLRELDFFWKENPSEMIQNKTKKNHVKKPCSAYALYLKEVKQDIKDQNPGLKMADVLKIVSERWKLLEKEKKSRYEARAEEEKEKARAKLGEKILSNDVSKEISLKKKKARQQNEIRKQIKADNGLIIQAKTNPLASFTNFYSQLEKQKSIEKAMTPQALSFETKSTNDSLSVKDEYVSSFQSFQKQELLREIQSVPPMFHNLHQQRNNIFFEAQKPLVLIPPVLFPQREPSQEAKANLLLQLIDQSVRSSSEYFLDLIKFSSNSGRMDSGPFYSTNSNPYPSTLSAYQQRATVSRPSRAQVLNSAIVSALGIDSDDITKKEEGDTNNDYFCLPKLE